MRKRRANQTARCLIGRAEGLRLTSYNHDGVWTIGWGTTRIDGKPVPAGLTITRDQAACYFNKDMEYFESEISNFVKVPLTSNQFSALVSLIYNIGSTQFKRSTLLRKLNAGNYDGAANEFLRWVYDDGKLLKGLVIRRRKERLLFLTPDA